VWEILGENATEVIALCALVLTSYQAYLSRVHNRLSLKPHLTRFVHRSRKAGQGFLAFELLNNGVGPAFIKSFEVMLDGKPISDTEKALKEVLADKDLNSTVATLGPDYAMLAGEKKNILILSFELETDDDLTKIEEKLGRFDLKIEYQSVYGEKATLDTRT